MNEIKKEDIKNEAGIIVSFKKLKKIVNSGIEKCICKIKQEIEIEGKKKLKSGTGFFFKIPGKDFKMFITNNHVINKEIL